MHAWLPQTEKPMKKFRFPKTDSIEQLAEFWDTRDLTDFEDELEEVVNVPVVERNDGDDLLR